MTSCRTCDGSGWVWVADSDGESVYETMCPDCPEASSAEDEWVGRGWWEEADHGPRTEDVQLSEQWRESL